MKTKSDIFVARQFCVLAALALMAFVFAQRIASAACVIDCDCLECYESSVTPGTFYSHQATCCMTYNTDTGKGGTATGFVGNYRKQYYGSRICEPGNTTLGKAGCGNPYPGSTWTRTICNVLCQAGT